MPSKKELERLAAKGRAEAIRHRAIAAALDEQAANLEKLAEAAGESGLPGDMDVNQVLRGNDTERTIRTMDVNTQGRSASVKRGAGRATRKHPGQKRLYEKGKTITDIAAELKEGRPRVSAWFAVGDANRPIPRRHAEHLEKKYGIPLNAWLRIAD